MQIDELQVVECRPSPLLERIPLDREVASMLAATRDHRKEGQERLAAWESWVSDIRQNGVRQPVEYYLDAEGRPMICDGRNRLAAATEAGLATIPGRRVDESTAILSAVATLAHRKHTSKAAVAYQAITFFPHLATGEAGRKKSRNDCGISPQTLDDLASMAGVSLRTMEEAAATYRELATRPAMRAKYEPLILSAVISLGGARAGIAGESRTAGARRKPSDWANASARARSLVSTLRQWDRWEPEERDEFAKAITQPLRHLPLAAAQALRDALQAAIDSGELANAEGGVE